MPQVYYLASYQIARAMVANGRGPCRSIAVDINGQFAAVVAAETYARAHKLAARMCFMLDLPGPEQDPDLA